MVSDTTDILACQSLPIDQVQKVGRVVRNPPGSPGVFAISIRQPPSEPFARGISEQHITQRLATPTER
jgi:hypothetical protein